MTPTPAGVVHPTYAADPDRAGAWACDHCGWRPILDRNAHTRAHNAALILEQEYDPDEDYDAPGIGSARGG